MVVKNSSEIKVSACVISYNQEKYIEQCIESIVKQKTEFAFEVVVRDDCSTDSTYEILCDLQKKYPSLIRLLDSSVNLGPNKNLMQVFDAAVGGYLAICEGDDYWIDPHKMQKQALSLDENLEINLCCHPSRIEFKGRVKNNKYVGRHSNKIKIIPAYDVIQGNGNFFSTPSLMLRRTAVTNLPEWFCLTPTIDYYLQVYGSLNSGCLYLPDPMSVYRKNAENSWTERMQTTASKVEFYQQFILFFDHLMVELDEKYALAVKGAKSRAYCGLALTYINASYLNDFIRYINLSWDTRPFFSWSQMAAYCLRFQPWVLRFMYKHARKFIW